MRLAEQDHELMVQMTAAILGQFLWCPREEARAIAAHEARRGSGRVGRTLAGRRFEERALTAAVVAAIRHRHTRYDELLMNVYSRTDTATLFLGPLIVCSKPGAAQLDQAGGMQSAANDYRYGTYAS